MFNDVFDRLTDGTINLVIPLLLVAVIYIADTVTRRAAGEQYRLSVRAGWWAGFVAFILFAQILADLPYDIVGGEAVAPYTVLPVALVVGFYLVHILRSIIPTRYGGFAVMVMVFLGASALFSYVGADASNEGLRAVIRYTTLGLTFGILMHAVVNPKSITDFYPHPDQNPFRIFMGGDGEDDQAGEVGQRGDASDAKTESEAAGQAKPPEESVESPESGKDTAPLPQEKSTEDPEDQPPAA